MFYNICVPELSQSVKVYLMPLKQIIDLSICTGKLIHAEWDFEVIPAGGKSRGSARASDNATAQTTQQQQIAGGRGRTIGDKGTVAFCYWPNTSTTSRP